MSDIEEATRKHYGQRNLGDSILAALRRMGRNVDALAPEDLAPVDAFHLRGRTATLELGRLAAPGPEHRALDVGCGLGGSARYLAATFGCAVTGLDLSEESLRVAAMLTGRTGPPGLVDFRQGSALEMPFEDAGFDLAWSEHAQMNIPDKPRLFAEIHRVLKPGGRFVFHDLLQGPGGAPHFPTCWAREPSYSALIDPVAFRALLQSLHFDVRHWEDKTAEGRDWLRASIATLQENAPPPLGFHLLIGQGYLEALRNELRNLEERRALLVQGKLQKVR